MVAVAPFMLRDRKILLRVSATTLLFWINATNSLKDSLAFAVEDK